MAVTFKEIDIVSSLFCRLSFSIRECQRGARFGIPCVFLFRVSDFIWFSHPYPRGKGESGTDRNSVFEAHGGRGWRALVWVHTGRRGPGEAVRFEVVLGYKWTQMADELPVFLGKISLARGTRKLTPLGTPCSPLLPGQPAPSQPFPGVAVAGATTVCAAPLRASSRRAGAPHTEHLPRRSAPGPGSRHSPFCPIHSTLLGTSRAWAQAVSVFRDWVISLSLMSSRHSHTVGRDKSPSF